MSTPGGINLALLSSSSAAVAAEAGRSVRFNSADSAYLSRGSWGTPTNRDKGTLSWWVKRSSLAATGVRMFHAYDGSSYGSFDISFNADYTIGFDFGGAAQYIHKTNAVFRDPSAWYHIVCAWDTTDSTPANRIKIYVNGVEQSLGTANYPAQNADAQFPTSSTFIGAGYGPAAYFNGYLADVYFLDGLTPGTATDDSTGSVTGIPNAQYLTDFGEFDTNGVWQPKEYTGGYGTNGFYLDFEDNSTASALGTDTSGNGNNWTVNNLSVTSGINNDSLRDYPTNGDTANDTGLGGQVPGNYCTWNPLSPINATYANGNLEVTPGSDGRANSTISTSTGKWYWEATVTATSATPSYNLIGIGDISDKTEAGVSSLSWVYRDDGKKMNSNIPASYGASYGVNDVIGVAWDADSGTLTFYKNGSSQGQAYTGLSGSYGPIAGRNASNTATFAFNFGQRAFAYPVSGFKALCTANLPTPTVAEGRTAMSIQLWTGNSVNGRAITGYGFSPDLVWIKRRNLSYSHNVFDTVRGIAAGGWAGLLYADQPNIEDTGNTNTVSSFDSDGFTLGVDGGVNFNTSTYVGWGWDAGSSTVTNNNGSIPTQNRANPSSGFSIVGWTGIGTSFTGTLGHGLNAEPYFIITKARNQSDKWACYHRSLGNTKDIFLNLPDPQRTYPTWNNTSPTSSVFSIGQTGQVNELGINYIAYCFAPVAGYSAFGSYTGNGLDNGPFVYTGMRPRWLLVKRSDLSEDWILVDSARNTYNVVNNYLLTDNPTGELQNNFFDFTSNGFKVRLLYNEVNASGGTFIYAAFAEHPFAYARAR